MGPRLEQRRGGRVVVFDRLRVRILAQVIQGDRVHVLGRVEEIDAAVLQLGQHGRVEHHRPAVDLHVAEALAHLVDVVADADGALHVGNYVLPAGVEGLHVGSHLGRELVEARKLGLVQGCDRTRGDVAGHVVVGWDHDVVASAAAKHLGLEHLVGIEGVIGDLDPGLLGELGEQFRIDVVGPVVDPQRPAAGRGLLGRVGTACGHRQHHAQPKGSPPSRHTGFPTFDPVQVIGRPGPTLSTNRR